MIPITWGDKDRSARMGGTNSPKAKRARPKLIAINPAPSNANAVLEGNLMPPPLNEKHGEPCIQMSA